MNKLMLVVVSASAATLPVTPAAAADFLFDVEYNGSGTAALSGGSDDPLSTVINVGDSFTYNLRAINGGYWTALTSTSFFAALQVTPCGSRSTNFSYSFSNGGANVASGGGLRNDSCVHIGEFSAPLSSGLVFDKITLGATVLPGSDVSTIVSLLPFFGAPESNGSISFTVGNSAVPEPAAWAMMLVGFGFVGGAIRTSKRRQKLTVSYA